jgi:phage baseplate assembly protein W
MYLNFPYQIDTRGRSAEAGADDHVRQLIEQVLFTSPGERVNRPDFGCGLKQLVFMPNSDALATATRQLVQASLQRWLADVIVVERVEVNSVQSSLEITVAYTRRDTGQRQQDVFSRPAGA